MPIGWRRTNERGPCNDPRLVAALLAGAYSTISYTTVAAKATESAVKFMMPRASVGTKMWARIMALGENAMTLDFYFGLHPYAG